MELNSFIVREMRTKKGWTQQQLSEISNLSLRTIQRVELNGLGSLETSKSLAAAFEIQRELLLVVAESPEARKQAYKQVPIYFLIFSFILGGLVGALALKLLS
jgi:transcriptional regulator with XRE-family HTH domain